MQLILIAICKFGLYNAIVFANFLQSILQTLSNLIAILQKQHLYNAIFFATIIFAICNLFTTAVFAILQTL